MKLHLGCGKRNFGPDWIHIDGGDFDHVVHHDLTKLPYDDKSVDLIYSSHVIEYFDREEIIPILTEWKRVLKVDGVLRLAVPDFGAMAKLYLDKNIPLDKFLGPLYGKMKMNDTTVYHKTTYDYYSLSNLLEKIGFYKVKEYNWRDTEHSMFDDHSQAYIPHMDKENGDLISLNVEAQSQPVKIICCSPPGTASTVLSNATYGLICPNEPLDIGKGAGDIRKDIIVTHDVDIDEWIKRLGPMFKLYFLVSERREHDKTIQSKYYDYDNLYVFQFEELNETPTYSVDNIIETIYNRLIGKLPFSLNKETAVKRIKDMNAVYEKIKNEPFTYVDRFYHIHGHHRGRFGRDYSCSI